MSGRFDFLTALLMTYRADGTEIHGNFYHVIRKCIY